MIGFFKKKITQINEIFDLYLDKLTIGFIFLYTFAATVVSLNRYWQHQNFYFDLGIFDMAIWRVAHFKFPIVDHINFGFVTKIIFADHFNPSIFLLSPLYWITDRTEVLLIAQSLAVGIAALIAYLLTKEYLDNKWARLSLIVAFLGYVGLQNALISDFHDTTVAVLPLMLIFWAALKKRWTVFFIFLIILLGLKESNAGLGVAIGLFLVIRKTSLKVGIATILICLIWGFLSIKYIIPYFLGSPYFFTPKSLPLNLLGFINEFLFPETKWKTIFYTYLTFGFLPIFDLSLLPAIFENFFERFILSDHKGRDLGMHYNATLSPLMFMGSLFTFHLLEKKFKLKMFVTIYSILIILIVIYLHRVHLDGPLGLAYNPVFYQQNARVRYVDDFLTQIPRDGVIMTHNSLATRFTHDNLRLLRDEYNLISPDYILLNLTPGQNINSYYPLTEDRILNVKESLLRDKNYILKKFGEEIYLFVKIKNEK